MNRLIAIVVIVSSFVMTLALAIGAPSAYTLMAINGSNGTLKWQTAQNQFQSH